MFIDAAGKPARCAAVLFTENDCLYTDGKPSVAVLSLLTDRRDAQIMALEAIAISLGLSTFVPELHNRKVLVFSDNTGAEACTRKGSANSHDHCQIVHQIWSIAFLNRTHLWMERVGTEYNISDLPSRGSYKLLRELKAKWRAPVMLTPFLDDLIQRPVTQ